MREGRVELSEGRKERHACVTRDQRAEEWGPTTKTHSIVDWWGEEQEKGAASAAEVGSAVLLLPARGERALPKLRWAEKRGLIRGVGNRRLMGRITHGGTHR